MSATTAKIEWYIARDGQQHGPLTADELDKFIELGHLRPTDLLWKAGFADWRAAAEVFPPQPPVQIRPQPAPQPAAQPARAKPTIAHTTDPRASEPRAAEPSFDPVRTPAATDVRPVNRAGQTAPAGSLHSFEPVAPVNPSQAHHQREASDRQAAAAFHNAIPHDAAHSAVTERPARHPQSQFGAAPSSAGTHRSEPQPHAPHRNLTPAAVPSASASEAAIDIDDDAYIDDDEPASRSGWLMVAAAMFVFVILGAGGLFAYNNQATIKAFYDDLAGRSRQPAEVAVVRAPARATREPAAGGGSPRTDAAARSDTSAPVAVITPPPAATRPLPELPILKSKLWQFAQREFGEWTQKRMEVVQQLSEQNKPKEEANKYLVDSFVKFRRDNAAVALLASPEKLAGIAEAFVASLRALTAQGPNTCYAYISNGEASPEIAPLYFEPATGQKLEAQMLAILQAIVDGKSTPNNRRRPPSADDFNKLSAELGKRGWSPADLKLFSDPNALSRAKPDVVCRLVTEWFATQTELADQGTRDQLIAASLRPVVGG